MLYVVDGLVSCCRLLLIFSVNCLIIVPLDVGSCIFTFNFVKKRAVRHSGAVLTYAPTYRPKDGICAGYIDSSIKFCRSRMPRILQRLQHSQPTMFFCS